MKTIWLVLAFFTRLPVPRVEYTDERYAKGAKLVPLVGFVTGAILYALSFFHLIFDPAVTALILLSGYIVVTGGLHLDGFADTCDGIFSGRSRERILEIMRDSRVGSYGVLAMLFFVAFYVVMYQRVPYSALILFPVVGKSAPGISAACAPYVRPEGLGKVFCDSVGGLEIFIAVAAPAVGAILLNPWYLIAVGTGLLSVVITSLSLKKKIGGITGDTLGMACEVSQMTFVFTVYAVEAILSTSWC